MYMQNKNSKNFLLTSFFESFYKTLPTGSILMSCSLDLENSLKTPLYSIAPSYLVIDNKITDAECGYRFSGLLISEFAFELGREQEIINKAFLQNKLYAIPAQNINEYQKINKAIFLDRDGILIEDLGYVSSIDRVKIKQEFVEIVKYANSKDYKVIITTNQAGVARGYFTEQDIVNTHNFISTEYLQMGAKIDAWYYCPYHTEAKIAKYKKSSVFRKPECGLHLLAIKDHNIDASRSLMLGDRDSDLIKMPYLDSRLIETPVYKIKNTDSIISEKSVFALLDSKSRENL